MATKSLQAILDIKSGKGIPADKKVEFLPGIEYTQANLAETGPRVWGSASAAPAEAAAKPGEADGLYSLTRCRPSARASRSTGGLPPRNWRYAHRAGGGRGCAAPVVANRSPASPKGSNFIVGIPWDYEAVLQDIERAHAAGIPFITVDQAPAMTDTVDYHEGADPFAMAAWRAAARRARRRQAVQGS